MTFSASSVTGATGTSGGNATGTGTPTGPETVQSTGRAASHALPTGAVALIGAAGGVLAAALAL